MSYINSIDIGKLYSVREMLCDGVEEGEKVNGCYRGFEMFVLKLAEFYLNHGEYEILDCGVLSRNENYEDACFPRGG